MKITVLDGVVENPGDLSWDGLERLGELTVYDRTSMTDEDEIVERIGNAEVVITNKTPLGRAVLERCPSIRFISVLATGYNVVDCDCAKEKGIPVSNVPAYGTDVVAQFAIALLLEICHHVGAHSEAVRQGRWENCPDWCFWDYPLIELAGKTMGIIGSARRPERLPKRWECGYLRSVPMRARRAGKSESMWIWIRCWQSRM